MFFKRLDIIGFKSFYNKTTLDFEPGITAIVGPNGCGKSNIFDSMRWVLGEQSVKALRGSQMEDVIFNGTETKEPLGMAEVSLVFDNTNKYFPLDHHEVAITRRIFRSGESDYLINKAQVRLKDILDLLMGTGIGAESYSLVQQGKIDLVLSSKSEDRRLVFDEASGISKYKSHKKETMRRLEETEQNLLRVSDIVAEVKRHISSLERQAHKARKYKEVFEELKSKEINLAVLQKKTLLIQKAEFIKTLNDLRSEEAALSETVKAQEGRMANRQEEIKKIEDRIMGIKNELLTLENTATRNNERINFNSERIIELNQNKIQLEAQLTQGKEKSRIDEGKLNTVTQEYKSLEKNIEDKTAFLKVKEKELGALHQSTKEAQEHTNQLKKDVLDHAIKISNTKNDIAHQNSQQQIFGSRKKRLELENAKVIEERATIENSLSAIIQELNSLESALADVSGKIIATKADAELQQLQFNTIALQLIELEKEKSNLESHKEFLSQLRTKYEDIGESLNALIHLDKVPNEKMSGLVIKVKEYDVREASPAKAGGIKITGEAKPIDLDASMISERIQQIQQKIDSFINEQAQKVGLIKELSLAIDGLQHQLHDQELALSNKKAYKDNVAEQLRKISQESEIIAIELNEIARELNILNDRLQSDNANLLQLEHAEKSLEGAILDEQNKITQNNILKEATLIAIAQTETELESLGARIHSGQGTIAILNDALSADKETCSRLEQQINDSLFKKENFSLEIKELEHQITEAQIRKKTREEELLTVQKNYDDLFNSASDVVQKLDTDRLALDALNKKIHTLEMESKDIDFKYFSIKERILQGYKIDLDTLTDILEAAEERILTEEIPRIKEKLDSYGTVNLVAIEEYDELKKRYDFLTQQQNDLVTAKEALHEAILKINRTTKKMFLETFEKVKEEFRSYFRLLFNGGDAQIFLLDEQDPLESGIEIICRPPGKKLQNILLLSGGEKALAAIALIFAIFKVKPAPFCVLDEIDAALDEANVDRFSKLLQEFCKISQFIVITHNKKTIANADVMYGITMEESGISKIVSVKFAHRKENAPQETPRLPSINQPA